MSNAYSAYGGYGNEVTKEYVAKVFAACESQFGPVTEVRLHPRLKEKLEGLELSSAAALETGVTTVPVVLPRRKDQSVAPFQVEVGHEGVQVIKAKTPENVHSHDAAQVQVSVPSGQARQQPVAIIAVRQGAVAVSPPPVVQAVGRPRGRPRREVPEAPLQIGSIVPLGPLPAPGDAWGAPSLVPARPDAVEAKKGHKKEENDMTAKPQATPPAIYPSYTLLSAEDMPEMAPRNSTPRSGLGKAVLALKVGIGLAVACRPHSIGAWCLDKQLAYAVGKRAGLKLRLYHAPDGRLCIVREA